MSPDYKDNNVKKQLRDKNSHLKIFKSLIKLRKLPVMQEGTFESLVDNNLLIYKREYAGKKLYVVLNLGKSEQKVNLNYYFPKVPTTLRIAVASLNSKLTPG